MLYVFIVTSGTTLKFDMNLAVKKVSELKLEIAKVLRISPEDEVLLCSGGKELESDHIVGKYYGAGTDTNPIFMFFRHGFDLELPEIHHFDSFDEGIEANVRGCNDLDPSISLINVIAELAGRFVEYADKGKKECADLVHQQHLQQQGWLAVVANMEDVKEHLAKQKISFENYLEQYLANRSNYLETVDKFLDIINSLEKIPLLKKLILSQNPSDETEHTLLSWFCTEPLEVIISIAEDQKKRLEQFNEFTLQTLNEEFQILMRNANSPEIKVLRGIEDRLSTLNKLIEEAVKIAQDTHELKGIFSADRINYAKDPNVLPDVCTTYKNQLKFMLDNHQRMKGILNRCTNAKAELSNAIATHIKIMYQIENDMSAFQNQMRTYHDLCKLLLQRNNTFTQVYLAPERYFKLLAEMVRRKEFSTSYMKWASVVSANASKLYQKEMTIRQSFSSPESRNMVDNLFPGMSDVPPSFAVKCPDPFDQNIPNITIEDLDWLRAQAPEFSHLCEVPAPDAMPYISQADTDSAFSSTVPSSLKVSSAETSHSNILKVHAKISALQKFIEELLRNLRSDVSTLKTSVQEDLCQGMTEAASVIQKVNASIEGFHQQVLIEKQELRGEVQNEFASTERAYLHRLEVESEKLNDAERQITCYEDRLQEMSVSLEDVRHEKDKLISELKLKEEAIKHIILEHELELDDYKNQMEIKVKNQDANICELKKNLSEAIQLSQLKEKVHLEELQRYQTETSRLQASKDSSKQIAELESKLETATEEKLQCVAELRSSQQNCKTLSEVVSQQKKALKDFEEKLNAQHRAEMDSLRSRYKMAVSTTSIERLTSPGSPESEQKNWIKMTEMGDKCETEKRAVKEGQRKGAAGDSERKEKDRSLRREQDEALLIARTTAKNQVSFNEAISRLTKEKDLVIEGLQVQVVNLERKLTSFKSILDSYLTKEVDPANPSALMSQSESSVHSALLHSEHFRTIITNLKKELEPYLNPSETRKTPLLRTPSTSAASTAPQKASEPASPCLLCPTKISVLTCGEGDLVLISYEEQYKNYLILQFGPHLHFLHLDCVAGLKIKLPPDARKWALGILTEKEFCQVKKSENRFNVPQGTKLFRVKVKPWEWVTALPLQSPVSSSADSTKPGEGAGGGASSKMSASAI